MKANDLTFLKVDEGEGQKLTCMICGNSHVTEHERANFLYVSIQIAAGATMELHVCTDKCEKKFKHMKEADVALKNMISAMRRRHRMASIKKM